MLKLIEKFGLVLNKSIFIEIPHSKYRLENFESIVHIYRLEKINKF
jgi:hypothetical protein